ncbi:MAG: FAD-dependent oxidoreductase, partial [Pseudomonadota bacterium]
MAGATPRVAIVGAGLAGLTAARRLADAGLAPVLFEKSRGLGGRLATRRAGDQLSFDHGAQFITAKSPEFEAFLKAASEIGDAALWRPRLADELKPAPDPWRVGAPGMSGLVSNLAAGLDIRLQTRIAGLTSVAGGWRIECEDTAAAATFDSVILTAPAKQTADLAETAGTPFPKAERAALAPCWALMAA